MLLTFEDFHTRVQGDIEGLINDLADWTGRGGAEEAESWRQSLPAVSDAFRDRRFDPLQLFFGNKGNCSLEYRLPASFSFSDIVLLGRQSGRPSAMFLELKHWQTRSDRPGPALGLIEHAGQITHHPSDQVKGYVDYCTHFHSAVQQFDASVSGCVAFTKEPYLAAYRDGPNSSLFDAFPCFSLAPGVDRGLFHDFIINRVNQPDGDFAQHFVEGRYQQRREFIRQLADQILNPDQQQFVLLDGQRAAFQECWHRIEQAVLKADPPRKTVIFIVGPPGCGKSVIAARLWASLVRDRRFPEGNCVITTTSASQSSNWEKVMGLLRRGGRGIVKKANGYMPATMKEVANFVERHPGLFQSAENWNINLATLRGLGHSPRCEDDEMLVSIVDEAHALINPEHRHGRGQFGFDPKLGPQAYHIIRGSLVSIFLLDPEQGFRTRENTGIGDMTIWAQSFDAYVPDTIRLDGTQFRCGGSKEYVDWIDTLWRSVPASDLRNIAKKWNGDGNRISVIGLAAEDAGSYQSGTARNGNQARKFALDIVETPFDLDEHLRAHEGEGASVRLVASYAREWKTRKADRPHTVPAALRDFQIPCEDGRIWSRIWNFAPKGDYTWFIQAPPGSVMHGDSLAEVGCAYAIRGFDYDYLGLLWLSDVVWRDNRWIVQPEHVYETGITGLVTQSKRESNPDGPRHRELLRRMQQSYRILMTRAIKGIYVWFEDEETREHVVSCMAKPFSG